VAGLRDEEDWLKLCEVVEIRKQTEQNPIAYCNEIVQTLINEGIEIDGELGKLISKIMSKGAKRGPFGKTWTDFARLTALLLGEKLPARIKILEGYHDQVNYSPYWRGFGKQPRSKQKTSWNKKYKIKKWEWYKKNCCERHYMPCECNKILRRRRRPKPTANEILLWESDIEEGDLCLDCGRMYLSGYPSGHIEYTAPSFWVIPLTINYVDSNGDVISTETEDSVVCRECYEKHCNKT